MINDLSCDQQCALLTQPLDLSETLSPGMYHSFKDPLTGTRLSMEEGTGRERKWCPMYDTWKTVQLFVIPQTFHLTSNKAFLLSDRTVKWRGFCVVDGV